MSGRAGVIYDVNIKYKSGGSGKTHSKKGFVTKKEAAQYEASMKQKLSNACYTPPTAAECKLTVATYLADWIQRCGKANLRPSTMASYQSHIKNHIIPYIGDVPLRQVTSAMLDDLFGQLADKGLSSSSARYAQRILGVAFEHARKYHYIKANPARDTITKFGKANKTPEPYDVAQMKQLLTIVTGTPWELIVILGGLYGLRVSEVLGLRWSNVDLQVGTFSVQEQLPFRLPADTTILTEMAPLKSSERTLPITPVTMPSFQRQLSLQAQQRKLLAQTAAPYYENQLVVAMPSGTPKKRERISANFGQLLRHSNLPHIRFHDLRHSAATNIHTLTGDFYTVSQILGHSLKGVGIQLGLSTNLESVTERYIDVRLDRKQTVLEIYHNAVYGTGT